MVKNILIKSPDEWATTKQACRDESVVYLFLSSTNIYIYIYICKKYQKYNGDSGNSGDSSSSSSSVVRQIYLNDFIVNCKFCPRCLRYPRCISGLSSLNYTHVLSEVDMADTTGTAGNSIWSLFKLIFLWLFSFSI